jgi:hypothetical protein
MHSQFPSEFQSFCESRADLIGFTGAKLITGSREDSKQTPESGWQIG